MKTDVKIEFKCQECGEVIALYYRGFNIILANCNECGTYNRAKIKVNVLPYEVNIEEVD